MQEREKDALNVHAADSANSNPDRPQDGDIGLQMVAAASLSSLREATRSSSRGEALRLSSERAFRKERVHGDEVGAAFDACAEAVERARRRRGEAVGLLVEIDRAGRRRVL